jgi:hypothetical protein
MYGCGELFLKIINIKEKRWCREERFEAKARDVWLNRCTNSAYSEPKMLAFVLKKTLLEKVR